MPDDDDPLREQLLDAAARVFARKGYAGAKIMDIVREAQLSTGAVYGRFESKNDLLREAVIRRARTVMHRPAGEYERVADLLVSGAAIRGPLSNDEAVQLEALVAARREPDVADALAEANRQWRKKIKPLVEKAATDGTVGPDVDGAAVLFFLQTLHFGLLLQRGAGATPPKPDAWEALMRRVIDSISA